MGSKLGRPKLAKGQSKGILIGARFNPAESKEVHDAVKRSKRSKSEWIRNALLDAASFEKAITPKMKIKLTVSELGELGKTPPEAASRGGFQNFLVQLQYRVDDDTGELELDAEDLAKIHRYAFHYKNGGWQSRLKKIFARTLGDDLSGSE